MANTAARVVLRDLRVTMILSRIFQVLFWFILLYQFLFNFMITICVMMGRDDQEFPELAQWMDTHKLGALSLYGFVILIWTPFVLLMGDKARGWKGLFAYHTWFLGVGVWCTFTYSGFFETFVERGAERHGFGWRIALCSGIAFILLQTSLMRKLMFDLPPVPWFRGLNARAQARLEEQIRRSSTHQA